tara:strand:- start:179 stop:349 length:171 start_codon:yes stop_codon:yes gene_type:complete
MINTVEKIYFNNQFISYQVTYENGKISSVPTDPANTDYQEIQQWISEGNTVIDNGE